MGIPPGLLQEVDGKVAIQAVPTGGTVGPDGALYVGEYGGFPYLENQAKIYRIGADGHTSCLCRWLQPDN